MIGAKPCQLTIKEKAKKGLSGGGGRTVMRSARPRQKVSVSGSAAMAVAAAGFVTVTEFW